MRVVTAPVIDFSFPHRWEAEILAARPLILPPRHFVYPREAEEVERGALEVLVRPDVVRPDGNGTDQAPADSPGGQPFLATCALGFRDPAVPTGLWSTPNPQEICAVSGGYAYIIHTYAPDRFTMIEYRPVLTIRPVVSQNLLLFVGHRNILAWGREGRAWQSEKLSDEGVGITNIESGVLRGNGWYMMTDKETAFSLDVSTGQRLPLS
jgi:hypothetical protein